MEINLSQPTDQVKLVDKLKSLMNEKWYGKDLTGASTIHHSIRIYNNLTNDGYSFEYCLCGLLHDVLEDSGIEVPELLKLGVPKSIIMSLSYLTITDHITRKEYITRIRTNDIARVVKIYDLRDNMDLMRLKKYNRNTHARFMRYAKEYYYLVDTNRQEIG